MRALSLVSLVILLGCSGSGPDPAAPSTRVNRLTPPETPAPSSGATAGAGYEVHEWGLLRAAAGDVLSAGSIAPPRRDEPIAVDKPVLYFHTRRPLHLERVAVDAQGGAIVEAWPMPPRTGIAAHLAWRDLQITPGAACSLSPLPSAAEACTGLPAGELCEVPSLATVRVPGAPCIRTPDGTDTLLFYRARTRTFTPPLRFARNRAVYDEIVVTNEGDAPIPGWLIRLHDDFGSVRALAVRPPAPHEAITVGADFGAAARAPAADVLPVDDRRVAAASPEPGRRAARETIRELGLTDAEADAFLRAWDEALFGLAPAGGTRVADIPAAVDELSDGEAAARDSFLYFLPPAACDQIAQITFSPTAPDAFRRAFAVWSPVRAIGASR